MNFQRSSNPAFSDARMRNAVNTFIGEGTMTVKGTLTKVALLFLLVLVTGSIAWKLVMSGNSIAYPLAICGTIAALIFGFIACFKPEKSYIFGPLYALAEGLTLGAWSAIAELAFSGIVVMAVGSTLVVSGLVFAGYRFGFLKASATFKKVIIYATLGVAGFYLVSMLLNAFGMGVNLMNMGWFGVVIELIIVGIAALNLVLDFDMIEQYSEAGVPASMEWYCAYGLMVTLLWIYIEILKLLISIMARSRD